VKISLSSSEAGDGLGFATAMTSSPHKGAFTLGRVRDLRKLVPNSSDLIGREQEDFGAWRLHQCWYGV
jgi:hypothetical protein